MSALNPMTYFAIWQRFTMACLLRALRQQEQLLHHHFGRRRAEDAGGHPDSPCKGPDLQDHYGQRSHDVDVEHI
jgi:hypothetical protein